MLLLLYLFMYYLYNLFFHQVKVELSNGQPVSNITLVVLSPSGIAELTTDISGLANFTFDTSYGIGTSLILSVSFLYVSHACVNSVPPCRCFPLRTIYDTCIQAYCKQKSTMSVFLPQNDICYLLFLCYYFNWQILIKNMSLITSVLL